MVGDATGRAAVSIQVKTSRWAWRPFKRDPSKSHWEWDVGSRPLDSPPSDALFYAFVDLCCEGDLWAITPKVFVVPSQVVHSFLKPEWKRKMFWIFEGDKDKYQEAWKQITDRLKSTA